MHPNHDWSLIWLETLYPGEIVINEGTITRPLATFRTMGGPLKIHLVTAPDLETRQRQGSLASPGPTTAL